MLAALPVDAAPPRLFRAVCLQLLALAALCLAADVRFERRKAPAEPPIPPEPRHEQRIRVVQIPKVEMPKPPAAAPKPSPPAAKPATASRQRVVHAMPRAAAQASFQPEPRATLIPSDSTSIRGVPLRVLVPRTPDALAAHLRNSGGCLVVSRLAPDGAEVLSVLGLDSGRAVEQPGPPCDGVPRLLRDASLNGLLGDPVGRARAELAPDQRGSELVLQVLLTPRLHDAAQAALRARFGDVSEAEMGEKAAESGYQLTCFAEPSGPVRCQ
ncbi:MAG TPA: hypothetical protein VFL36_16225 [Myxococcales bacterium]|nr:hypothetical protein [Myxococcales bacterium]